MGDEQSPRRLWDRRLCDRRLAILVGLIALPYIVSGSMLFLYYDLDESFSRHVGILLAMEYEAPILYGAVPAVLLWCAESRNRQLRWSGRGLLLLVVGGLAVARAAQTLSILFTRHFIGWEDLGRLNMVGFVLTTSNISLFLSIVVAPLVLVGLAWSPRYSAARRSVGSYLVIIAGCVGLSFFASYRADRGQYLERFSNLYGISYSHETSMLRMLLRIDGGQGEESESLSAETRDRLLAFGIRIQPDAERPFAHDKVFDPADVTPWEAFERPPDIVILFVESLSAELLGCYGGRADISPWIDQLARRSIQFTNYFNHSTPTVCSLHGSLSSTYQVAGHDAYSGDESNLIARCRTLSLAHVLRARGYDTTYFGSGSPYDDHLGEVMANLGFQRRLFAEDLRKEYSATTRKFEAEYPSCGTRLVSDILMCRYVKRFMTQPSKRPRLLCASTIGMHFPYEFGEGVRYGDGSQPVLNAVHLLDRALAESSGFLKGRDREVVFVLTADHAMFPTRELIAVRGKEFSKFLYDRIALVVSRGSGSDGTVVDTLSSSVDLAPTLLHLLGINVPNPFMGWSIFSGRGDFPRLLGSHNKHLFVKTSAGEWSPMYEVLSKMPDIALGNGETFTAVHFREWLAYLRFQMRRNRIW